MKASLTVFLRRWMPMHYWADRQIICRGWRVQYAAHILRYSRNDEAWQRETKELRRFLRRVRTELGQKRPFFLWKLKLWGCRTFSGAILDQDFIGQGQAEAPLSVCAHVVTNGRTTFVNRCLNSKDAQALCTDKYRSALHWADWYHRGFALVSSRHPLTVEALTALMNGRDRVIVKPLDMYGGAGIRIWEPVKQYGSTQACAEAISRLKGRHIVEEFVEQVGPLHELNPSSVNTVRIITARYPDGTIAVLNAFLRVGQPGSVVDNSSSGGFYYPADHHTGVLGPGADEAGHLYHDRTGWKLPRWEEAVEFCLSAHRHAPEGLRYVGWDVCISDDGLSLIEVNDRPGHSFMPGCPDNPWKALRGLLDAYEKA